MTNIMVLPVQKILDIPIRFAIQKQPYSMLKIIPFKTGYTAKDFEKIMNTIHKYQTPFLKRFEIKDRTLIYHPEQPFCFEILFTNEKITYSYAIPNMFKELFINKVRFILGDCDIVEIEDNINIFQNSIRQNYKYDKTWMMSLNTDDKINLNDSLIVLTKDLQPMDKILMQYIFQPLADYDWKNKWQPHAQYGSINDIWSILDVSFSFLLNQIDLFINGLMTSICGEEPITIGQKDQNFIKELSEPTKHKTVYDGFKTNINIYYKTSDGITSNNISRNIATIFKDIDGDNGLKAGKTKQIKNTGQLERKIARPNIIINTRESVQLIKTPSETMLREYGDMLDKITIADIEIPKELLRGKGIELGDLLKGSKYTPITFGNDINSNSKPIVYLSPQEGGKSSFLRMYAVNAVAQGDSIFAFDTIDGKNVDIIRDYLPADFPEEKIVILDFRNTEYAFPLMWNELFDSFYQQLSEAKDEFDHYRIMENFSDIAGSELIRFVDIFQAEDRQNRLTPNMRSYLVDLAQLVFMNGGNFGMIRDCLHNTALRYKLLHKLNLPRHLPMVQSIMRIDNEGDNSLTLRGIETRLNLIMENATLKKYFSIESEKKIDFAHWANNGYCVLIQIPEQFSDPVITFLVQKLWLAITTSRYNIYEENRPMTHLLIDEPNRFPTIMNLLNDHLIASRKWHLRFLFFIHNIDIFRGAGDNLKNAGTTFIMLPTSRYNFNRVEEFYMPLGFDSMQEVEKQISRSNGKRRFALTAIHYKNVWYPCIVRLPLPIEKRNEYVDRKHLNLKCAQQYGISQREYYKTLFGQGNSTIDQSGISL